MTIGLYTMILQAAPAAAPAGDKSFWVQFGLPLQLLAMGLVFWFLILRPQSQARKKQAELLSALKKGDDVMTVGGIVGVVKDIKEVGGEVRVTVESGTSTVVVERSRIIRVGNASATGTRRAGMSLLTLHLLGSPVLRQRSAEVDVVDDEIRKFIDDMFETMAAAKGVGLAANQVGVAKRVAVIDAEGQRFAMVNPRIVSSQGRDTAEEGCLSIPDVFGDVTRPAEVTLEALDRDGQPFRLEASGLVARAIQHEIDHLDGIIFLDHLGALRRAMLLKRFRKEHAGKGYLKEVRDVEPEEARRG